MAITSDYTNLITSEHNQKPNYVATVALNAEPFVDLMNVYDTFSTKFDLATPPVGDQLDKIGAWVGANRNLKQEVDGISTLPDAAFLLLIKLLIAMNYWDGTVPGAYKAWNVIFVNDGVTLLIQSYPDMTMAVVFIFASTPDDLTLAILVNGYFELVPAGVRVIGYFEPDVPGEPIFGLGIETSLISGLGVGYIMAEI